MSSKPSIIIFNKVDAYKFVLKEDDDLTPMNSENFSLDIIKDMWMSKLEHETIFISALEKTNLHELRELLYKKIKGLHEVRYPYNNFLY